MSATRGRFLVLDGIGWIGKVDASSATRREPAPEAAEVVHLREPGSTAFGESVRALLLSSRAGDRSRRRGAPLLCCALGRCSSNAWHRSSRAARGSLRAIPRLDARATRVWRGGVGFERVAGLLDAWAAEPRPRSRARPRPRGHPPSRRARNASRIASRRAVSRTRSSWRRVSSSMRSARRRRARRRCAAARPWSPRASSRRSIVSFDELVGLQQTLLGLWEAARAGRLPHAMLFRGPAGVGKFQGLLLLARGMLCECGARRAMRALRPVQARARGESSRSLRPRSPGARARADPRRGDRSARSRHRELAGPVHRRVPVSQGSRRRLADRDRARSRAHERERAERLPQDSRGTDGEHSGSRWRRARPEALLPTVRSRDGRGGCRALEESTVRAILELSGLRTDRRRSRPPAEGLRPAGS